MTGSSAALPVISNRQARRLLLASAGLLDDPGRRFDDDCLLDLVERMGFVQVDSINTVERAHHQILFSRNQNYRQAQLARLIEGEAALFENWTHDAAIIPSRFYPYWHHRFARERDSLRARWRKWRREGFEDYFGGVQFIQLGVACERRVLRLRLPAEERLGFETRFVDVKPKQRVRGGVQSAGVAVRPAARRGRPGQRGDSLRAAGNVP